MRIRMILILLSSLSLNAFAQESVDSTYKINYVVSTEVSITSKNTIPFWMRTNKFGALPLSGLSNVSRVGVFKEYSNEKKGLNLGFGLDANFNIGNYSNFQLIQAYGKIYYRGFEVKVGRSQDIVGLVDSSLSSGAFSISGNSLGIPKAELSIPEYVTLPFTNAFVSIKGNFAIGSVGNEPIKQQPYTTGTDARTFYHGKSFYVRLGQATSKLNLYGGFNHNVFWGGENDYFKGWNLSNFDTFIKVVYGGVHKQSKVGNHMGSIDQMVSYKFAKYEIQAYHQFFYEVGGLIYLNNIKDGLWGLVIKNRAIAMKPNSNKALHWKKVLVEIFTSKSQGGELDAKVTPSGDEDYYNNYIYSNGWKYMGENLGNNFITSSKYIRKSLPARTRESHNNNRLYLMHLAAEFGFRSFLATSKLSFSRNFGTYGTSPDGNTTGGGRNIFPPPYFPSTNQLSFYLEVRKALKKNYLIGISLAADRGGLLYNSEGTGFKITKVY